MTDLDALVVTVAHGQRLAVMSDLDLHELSQATDPGVVTLTRLLRDGDDALCIVLAGNLFRPSPTTDLARLIDLIAQRLPDLTTALAAFRQRAGSRIIALPGSRDHDVLAVPAARAALERWHVEVAPSVQAWIDTPTGTRALRIVAGLSHRDLSGVAATDLTDAERLGSPEDLGLFLSSRSLYRRYAVGVWLPVVALLAGYLAAGASAVISHYSHRPVRIWRNHHLHILGNAQGPWTTLLVALIAFAFIESLVALFAGWQVRRHFGRSDAAGRDALGDTHVDGVAAISVAREVSGSGGMGVIVGGAPSAATIFLDRGVCAAPGPSRAVTTKLTSRFGLPPVFATAPVVGVVEVIAGTSAHLRLSVRESVARGATVLERLVSLAGTAHNLEPHATVVSSWPTGNPWPPSRTDAGDLLRRRQARRAASFALFITGVLNLVAALTPPLHSRLQDLLTIVPLGVAQSAQAITAIAGVALIMLARSLRRGQRRAWRWSSGILALTVFTHLARGEAIASTLISLAVLVLLVLRRHDFEATGDGDGTRHVWPRVLALAAVGVATSVVSVEVSSPRHLLPSTWRVIQACTERLVGVNSIALPDNVNDFVQPSLFALGIVLIVILLYNVTRPVVDRRLSEHATSRERRLIELRARDIVKRYGRGTLDYFALRDDKQFFFFRDSLVAYAVYGGVALISPDPIGPPTDRADVFAAFRDFAESRGWTTAIVGAGDEWLPTYRSAGYHHIYVGDEALVDCTTFSLEGGKMKSLRQAVGRLSKKGYTVEFIDPAHIDPAKVPPLLALIAMLRRGDGERGFSMMLGRLFHEKDQGLLLTVVYGPDGTPAACCQFVPTPATGGFSLDLMRRDPGDHPNGLIDYALCETIRHLGERGVTRLSLNFAAFRSVLDGEKGDGVWMKVERWALRRLSGILPIETLWSFNNKYQPSWNPRYLVYPAVESFVPVVAAVLRAESLTEIPVIGRLLANDPSNRPGTVVPDDVLERATQTN